MNKEKVLHNYTILSILIGIYFVIGAYLYTGAFGSQLYGIVEKTVFKVTISTIAGDIVVFNTPFLIYLIFLVFNVLVFVLLGLSKKVKEPLLKSVAFYNAVLIVVLIMGQLFLVYAIPKNINGDVVEKFIFTVFPYTNDVLVNAININYIVALLYIGYNMYVSIKTLPVKKQKYRPHHDLEIEADYVMKKLNEDEK